MKRDMMRMVMAVMVIALLMLTAAVAQAQMGTVTPTAEPGMGPEPPPVVVVEPNENLLPTVSEIVLVAVVALLGLLLWGNQRTATASGETLLNGIADKLLDATPPWMDDVIKGAIHRAIDELDDRAAMTEIAWDDAIVDDIAKRVAAIIGSPPVSAEVAGADQPHDWDAGK